MMDRIRTLSLEGSKAFESFVAHSATGGSPLPIELLTDERYSNPFDLDVAIERAPGGKHFRDRYAFGQYLSELLAPMDRRQITRDVGLWNWLSLFYFDQLCPIDANGDRSVLAHELYVMSPQDDYRRLFRHLVRAPWFAVTEHGGNARVLLIHTQSVAPLASRGGIFEQLASRQTLLANHTTIAAAQALYFDERASRPHFGVIGQNTPGSVQRFALVAQQLELTFDTWACGVDKFLQLLPREFDQWKRRLAA